MASLQIKLKQLVVITTKITVPTLIDPERVINKTKIYKTTGLPD